MSRSILFAVILFAVLTTNALAQGPVCNPNDQWCRAGQRAAQWAQQAQQRLNRDWNNVGNDVFGQQNIQQLQQGVQGLQNVAQRGGMFNCTNWRQAADAYGRSYLVCAQ